MPSSASADFASSSLSKLRPLIATRAPAFASPRAMAKPSPEPPPVISATRAARSNGDASMEERSANSCRRCAARSQRRQNFGGRKGHRTKPDTGRVEDRVGDRRRHDRCGRLTSAPRLLLRPIDQIDCDFGYVRERQNRICTPIEARHGRAVELQVFDKRSADRLDDVAFDLVAQAIRIDDLAAIMRDMEFLHRDLAGGSIDLDIGDRAYVGAHELVFDVSEAATLDDAV